MSLCKSVWRYTEGLCHCMALLHYHFNSHESRGWAQTLTICDFHETFHIKMMSFVLGAPSQHFRKYCVPTLKQHFFILSQTCDTLFSAGVE